jgi:hypothetical protein
LSLLLLGVLLVALSPMAQAIILLPGGGTLGPGDPFPLTPSLADTFVVGTMPTPILFATPKGKVTGEFKQVVYRNIAGESAVCPAGGCLDFYYQVHNDLGSADTIARITAIDFTGFMTDVGFSAGTLVFPLGVLPGIAPSATIAAIGVDRAASGDTIGFEYTAFPGAPGILVQGSNSAILVIRTNAQFYTDGQTSVIDGGAANIDSFAPAVVPEPGSIVLLGTALFGAALLARRKFARS